MPAFPSTENSRGSSVIAETPRGIFSLPPELMCAIFCFTCAQSESSSPARTPPPVHILTRVCRFWRGVSHDLSELWTDIRIFHCRSAQLASVSEYVRRSGTLPLDVCFDVDVRNRQLANFWPVILKIWAVAHRWRELRIITTTANFRDMQFNLGRKAAPWLEHLELRVSDGASSTASALSFGSTPVLKALVLNGTGMHSSEPSSFVGQLETLDLSFSPFADLITQLADAFDAFSEHTHAISPLRHLTLRGTPPPSGALVKSYTSTLTTLTLGSFRGENLPMFCLSPLLEELSLSALTHASWQTFCDSLTGRTFPALRALTLTSVEANDLPVHLSSVFPALEHLSLLHRADSLLALSKTGPDFWPALHTLTLDNANYRALCAFVEARIAAGHPLAFLEVDSPQFIDASSLQWLQRHVKGFKRTPRAR
ncbi:hypothetical protein B0H17DRAFT_168832 [Mycena rosella]|uniref:F-box domain-containing protein n=1 Tax=Mycena rosella TaxID=1033263 RepID=A0AAD7G7A8_MYCRO|nr:hypothetical protein B0H17DRAFT_168832 [Mycena rosella]